MDYTIAKKAIQLRHPDYNPDRAQKLIRSTRNISSKFMHAFLSNLANRQTDRCWQTHLPPPLSEVITAQHVVSDTTNLALCPTAG